MINALAVRNKEGRFIGRIEGDQFIKEIANKHLLRKPPAICIDADPFDKLIKPACKYLKVINKEALKTYVSSVGNFVQNKGEIDRGFGKQYFMILERWQVR